MGLEIINKVKKQKGLTNARLAEMSGVTLSTLDKITSGINTNPKLETMLAICRALGCHLADFDDAPFAGMSDEAIKVSRNYDRLDYYGQKVVSSVFDMEYRRCQDAALEADEEAGGKIITLFSEPAAAGIANPASGWMQEVIEAPAGMDADFAVRISGNSMEPYLPDGSIAYVSKATSVADGEVGLFYVAGSGSVCKQFCSDLYGNVHLFSLNREREDADIHILAGSGIDVFVQGKVIMEKYPPLP